MKILLTVHVGMGKFKNNYERELRLEELQKFIKQSFSGNDLEVLIVPAMKTDDIRVDTAVLISDPAEFEAYRVKQIKMAQKLRDEMKKVFGK